MLAGSRFGQFLTAIRVFIQQGRVRDLCVGLERGIEALVRMEQVTHRHVAPALARTCISTDHGRGRVGGHAEQADLVARGLEVVQVLLAFFPVAQGHIQHQVIAAIHGALLDLLGQA